MRRRTFIVGVLSSSCFITGIVFKYLHLSGANNLMIIGIFIFLMGFGISFLIDRLSIETRKSYRIALIILFVSISLMLISFVLRTLHLPGGIELGTAGIISFIIFAVYFNRQIEGRNLRIRKDRQLAAILFTDIKGFTKMMGEDEYKGMEALEKNRTIQKRLIRKYYGKWLKEIGDGTLSIFYTASEAVLCALEIQEAVMAISNEMSLYSITSTPFGIVYDAMFRYSRRRMHNPLRIFPLLATQRLDRVSPCSQQSLVADRKRYNQQDGN